MAMKYGDFKFDSKHGFSGSAGKKAVRGYLRGGPVRKARGGPPDEYEASSPRGKTIEDIIEETKGIEVKKPKEGTYKAKDMTAKEMFKVKATADAERKKRQMQDQYDSDTEDMREEPMNKAKGGFAKMAGMPNRVAKDQDVANMQKQNYAKGGPRVPAPKQVSPKAPMKMAAPKMPAAMAVPPAPKPRAAPSLASIAASRNPAMMMGAMKKGGMTKVGKVMHEFKAGELHSGSKKGPMVKNRKQAIAIALSEARKGKK